MRIIKPLNIGLLTRNFARGGQFWLSVGAACFFDFNNPDEPLGEQEMWGLVPGETEPGSIFDEGLPKARAEVLLCGECHAPGRVAVPGLRASLELGPPELDPSKAAENGSPIQVGEDAVRKVVEVVGDRAWQPRPDGEGWEASLPLPFTSMDLKPEQALGGEGLVANPGGKGFLAPEAQPDPQGKSPLPNLVAPGQIPRDPWEAVDPVGFFPLGQEDPRRAALFGTCDERWVSDVFPENPRDTNPAFYNQAPADQQVPGFWRGDEQFICGNMHPEKPRLQGRICPVSTRCFVTLKGAGGVEEWREVPMARETVWLFPHQEKGVVIHRGVTRTGTFTGQDVESILLAYELPGGEVRPAAAYKAALAARLDDDTALEYMARQDDLSPPEVARAQEASRQQAVAAAAAMPPEPEHPLVEQALAEARQRTANEMADGRDVAAGVGVNLDEVMDGEFDVERSRNMEDAAELLPHLEGLGLKPEPEQMRPSRLQHLEAEPLQHNMAPPPVNSLADAGPAVAHLQQLQAKMDAMEPAVDALMDRRVAQAEQVPQQEEAEAREVAKEMGLDYDQLKAQCAGGSQGADPLADLQQVKAFAADDPEAMARISAAETQLQSYQQELALAGGQNPALNPEFKPMMRQAAHHAPPPEAPTGEAAASLETRAGALRAGTPGDLDSEDLASADLAGAQLAGADLKGVVFTGADLSGADLGGADLSGAILAHADLSGAVLTGAVLREASLGKAMLRGADLSGVDLRQGILSGADLSGANLSGADLRELEVVMEATLKEADLSGVKAGDLTFLRCDLSGANLGQAELVKTVFLECTLEGADLSGANLEQAHLMQVKAAGCQLGGARAASLATAGAPDFSGAGMKGADLSQANFRGANLAGADLSGAKLELADLSEADLSGANLEQALAQGGRFDGAVMVGARMAGVNLKGASVMAASLDRADLRGALLFDTNAAYATSEGILLEGASITRCKLGQARPGEGSA